MTSEEYRELIARLGLDQRQAAKWLGVSRRTSQNYATGGTEIPGPTARLLRLVDHLRQHPTRATTLEAISKLMMD